MACYGGQLGTFSCEMGISSRIESSCFEARVPLCALDDLPWEHLYKNPPSGTLTRWLRKLVTPPSTPNTQTRSAISLASMQFSAAALLAGITAVSAAPHVVVRDEPATCGSVEYTASQVSAAMDAACEHFQDGTEAGSYPHTYNNYEGFDFKGLDGPFQEFPIMEDGDVYTGGTFCFVNLQR